VDSFHWTVLGIVVANSALLLRVAFLVGQYVQLLMDLKERVDKLSCVRVDKCGAD